MNDQVTEFEVEVNKLFFATGRNADIKDLNLEAIKIRLNNAGSIVVNEFDQTSCDSIYAIGDVSIHQKLTPIAIMAGRKLSGIYWNYI